MEELFLEFDYFGFVEFYFLVDFIFRERFLGFEVEALGGFGEFEFQS